jgi:hypothetical protein
MLDANTPILTDIATDPDGWQQQAAANYRDLARSLRDIVAKCCLPNPQRELLALARTYDRRAEHLQKRRPTFASRR